MIFHQSAITFLVVVFASSSPSWWNDGRYAGWHQHLVLAQEEDYGTKGMRSGHPNHGSDGLFGLVAGDSLDPTDPSSDVKGDSNGVGVGASIKGGRSEGMIDMGRGDHVDLIDPMDPSAVMLGDSDGIGGYDDGATSHEAMDGHINLVDPSSVVVIGGMGEGDSTVSSFDDIVDPLSIFLGDAVFVEADSDRLLKAGKVGKNFKGGKKGKSKKEVDIPNSSDSSDEEVNEEVEFPNDDVDMDDVFEEDAPENVPPGRGTIGVGFDVTVSDLWSFQGLRQKNQFYSNTMPDSCFMVDPSCTNVLLNFDREYTSVKRWAQEYSSSFSIDASAGVKGFETSIRASIDTEFGTTWSIDKNITRYLIMKTRKCFQLLDTCAYNEDYLNPKVRRLLDGPNALPMVSTDRATMELWVKAFFRRVGTHIAVKSSHGAMLQGTTSADASCEWSVACRNFQGCLKLGFMDYVKLELCAKQVNCKETDSCVSKLVTKCVAVGGDSNLTSTLCSNKRNNEARINRFLDSGDMDSISSTVSMNLQPVSELLFFMGLWESGLHVEKVLEYYTCNLPEGEWVGTGTNHYCKCVRKCKNGGTLDPNSCTCKCRGTRDHGWIGVDCSREYGVCQRGVGSSGTPSAIAWNCKKDNECTGYERSDTCENHEVCCNRDEGGLCCPFGSRCDCFSNGRRFCRCA
mmetsp:Transcript_17744/g.17920  ORF Transcript_17744/g.17920 Transcript_17744/m.17920 type:complete len:683 (-) Transcript_17744:61-2109(-)